MRVIYICEDKGKTSFIPSFPFVSTETFFRDRFCAHEYEKSKDMGAAALAYKCMEVAYMRVVKSSYTSANRYRNELQTSLQMVPPGKLVEDSQIPYWPCL